jgi:hypothetical protein
VLYGVRREFAYDEGDRTGDVRRRRVALFPHPPHGVTPGELRTTGGGGELQCERPEFTLRHVSRGGGFCQHGLSVPFPPLGALRCAHESSRSVLKSRLIVLRSTGGAALFVRP